MGKILCIGWDVGSWNNGPKKNGDAIALYEYAGGKIVQLGFSDVKLFHEIVKDPYKIMPKNAEKDYERIYIAIDSPLGFPSQYLSLVKGDYDFFDKNDSSRIIYERLAHRKAEDELRKDWSFKVGEGASLSRISNIATKAMVHINLWRKNSDFSVAVLPFDREDDKKIIVFECYANLIVKEILDPKKRVDENLGAEIGDFVEQYGGLEKIGISLHQRDANICALWAMMYALQPDLMVKPSSNIDINNEGWIYYPDPKEKFKSLLRQCIA